MNLKSSKQLKRNMAAGKITLGSWVTLADTSIVEIMMKAGFDWLTIDMEHSAITLAQAQQLIRIIDLSSVSPLVRVGENNSLIIKRVMDAGAQGVIVPMVNSAQEALLAVAAVKYPPWGKRGVGLARAQGYGLTFNQYREWVNKYSIVIVQIEHIDAVNNIDEILSIKGVDGSIVGPYDLSASMGYPGEFNRKDVKQAIDKYLAACAKLKKPAGFHVIPPQAGKLQEKIKQGFKFLGFSLDTLFIGAKLKAELEKIII